MLISLAIIALVLTAVSASDNATDINLDSSHNCGRNLHHCHVLNAWLTAFCIFLFLSNICTVVWFTRRSIRNCIARLAERLGASNNDTASHSLLVPDN